MSIKILSKDLVKPSTPTPPHLRNYKLSFIDELLPLMEVGVLLFYTSKPNTIDLKDSLAKVLSSFYPLAGRFMIEDHIVDCSDQGAEFLEAEAPDSKLSILSMERNLENLHGFLPRKNDHQDNEATYPILSIQITNLKCGGLAIGISISHKVFDVSALSTFVTAWSNAGNVEPKTAFHPTFEASSLFRSKNRVINPSSTVIRFLDMQRISVKRFSFDKEAIARLRSNLKPKQGMSKVRAVCAVIARALILVDRKKMGGRPRDCLITQAVNMRERTVPSLHKHACGNLVLLSLAQYYNNNNTVGSGSGSGSGSESESEPVVQVLADLLGNATSRSVADCSGMLRLDEDGRNEMLMTPLRTASKTFLSGEANIVTFTDYSKFEFYEMDFGLGKPVSAGIAPHTMANTVVLMGNRDGDGIEAWVHLEKNDMCLFEEDEEIRILTANRNMA